MQRLQPGRLRLGAIDKGLLGSQTVKELKQIIGDLCTERRAPNTQKRGWEVEQLMTVQRYGMGKLELAQSHLSEQWIGVSGESTTLKLLGYSICKETKALRGDPLLEI